MTRTRVNITGGRGEALPKVVVETPARGRGRDRHRGRDRGTKLSRGHSRGAELVRGRAR